MFGIQSRRLVRGCWKGLLLALVVPWFAACTKPAEPDLAERAVPQFHMALMGGDFDGMYQRASPELRQRQSQADFVRYLQSVRRTLGDVQGTERTATQVDGRIVTLTYASTYSLGKATEEFVVRAEEGREPAVASYRVLTPALR